MRNKDITYCSRAETTRELKKLMETPPAVDRNKTPPPCRLCTCFRPEFRYRKCLYAVCPYGKDSRAAFRRKPLRGDPIMKGGGEMSV